jgi:hypothetical protein
VIFATRNSKEFLGEWEKGKIGLTMEVLIKILYGLVGDLG